MAWARGRADRDPELLQDVEFKLFPLCVAAGDWRTAGRALTDPVEQVRGLGASLEVWGDEPQNRDARRRLTSQMRERAAERYAALLAAGRIEVAADVAKVALRYADDDRTRATLLRRAFEAGQLDACRDRHLKWLEDLSSDK